MVRGCDLKPDLPQVCRAGVADPFQRRLHTIVKLSHVARACCSVLSRTETSLVAFGVHLRISLLGLNKPKLQTLAGK